MDGNENGNNTNGKKYAIGNITGGMTQGKIVDLSAKDEIPASTTHFGVNDLGKDEDLVNYSFHVLN